MSTNDITPEAVLAETLAYNAAYEGAVEAISGGTPTLFLVKTITNKGQRLNVSGWWGVTTPEGRRCYSTWDPAFFVKSAITNTTNTSVRAYRVAAEIVAAAAAAGIDVDTNF